jgi:hypothetical protein
MRPGSRLITISADMEGWEPTIFDSDELIFIYRMPPTPGSLGSFLAKQESVVSNDRPLPKLGNQPGN